MPLTGRAYIACSFSGCCWVSVAPSTASAAQTAVTGVSLLQAHAECENGFVTCWLMCSRGMLGWIVLILVAWCGSCWGAPYLDLSRLNFLKR